MKSINDYINEGIKLGANSKLVTLYRFEHIDKNDHKCLWGYNWILNHTYWDTAKALLNWTQKNCRLNTNEQTFIEKFIESLEENKKSMEKLKILNGSQNNGYYNRPKCLYDICKLIKKHHEESNVGIDKDEIDNIINELDRLTNGDIKYLDWPH